MKRRLKRLKFWAMYAPENFLGKQLLLEAELAALRGDRQKAISSYRSSILHSRETNFMLEEALANERLANLYLDSGEDDTALSFLMAARDAYRKWGADAKVAHFEEEYSVQLEKGQIC